MITIKLKDIIVNEGNLRELMGMKLPIKVSYKLSKIIKNIDSELNDFRETRNKIVIELGELDEETKEYRVLEKNNEAFFKQIKELTDSEVALNFEPIKIDELSEMNIEPKYLVDWLFE